MNKNRVTWMVGLAAASGLAIAGVALEACVANDALIVDAGADTSVDAPVVVDSGKDASDGGGNDAAADPDADAAPPTVHCVGNGAVQAFDGGKVFGCAGKVNWPKRATLCGPTCTVCGAATWVAQGGVPAHNYWTDDRLGWKGTKPGACEADLDGGSLGCGSPTDSGLDANEYPMRVCVTGDAAVTPVTDPEGNTCFWHDCGFNQNQPSAYFGGCSGDYTAGSLCCCP